MENSTMPSFSNQPKSHADWRSNPAGNPAIAAAPAVDTVPTAASMPPMASATPTQPEPRQVTTSAAPNIPVSHPSSAINVPTSRTQSQQPAFQVPPSAPVSSPSPVSAPVPTASLDQSFASPTPAKPARKNIFAILTIVFGIIAVATSTALIYLVVNGNNQKTTTPSTPVVTTEQVTENIIKSLGFFPSKLINPSTDVTYRIGVHRFNYDGSYVFGSYIGGDKSSAEVYVYWEYIQDYYGVETDRKTRENITISFDQSVSEVYLGESGTSVKGDVLLFLLEDGTVEYMPVVEALKNHDFRSYGQLGGVEDIVKFYRADAITDERSYYTTLVQRANGSIIDLQSLLRTAAAGEKPSLIEVVKDEEAEEENSNASEDTDSTSEE